MFVVFVASPHAMKGPERPDETVILAPHPLIETVCGIETIVAAV
jgi:hypothetical protein